MKKAIVPLWISLFFSFIAVILLLVFFFIFLRGDRAPATLAIEESFTAEAHAILNNYLNAPVVVQGEQVTFADLIRLWYADRTTYEPLLKSATQDYLNDQTTTYTSVGGTTRKRFFWLALHERTSQGGIALLLTVNQQLGKMNPGEAITYVPVSEDRTVRITMFNAELA